MIPKIIHYCWFGRGKYNELIERCMDSWKKILPDYEIRLWNEDTFNVEAVQYTREAYEVKKYAFVSDYVRLYALYEYGGIYLDTDVEVLKSFDEYLKFPGFAGIEEGVLPACGVIGAEKRNDIIGEFFKYYQSRSFYNDIGEYDLTPNPCVFEKVVRKYGFVKKNMYQEIFVKGRRMFVFLEQMFFCPPKVNFRWAVTDTTVSIHHYDGSWAKEKDIFQIEYEAQIEEYEKIFGKHWGERVYRTVKRIKKYGFMKWIKMYISRKVEQGKMSIRK